MKRAIEAWQNFPLFKIYIYILSIVSFKWAYSGVFKDFLFFSSEHIFLRKIKKTQNNEKYYNTNCEKKYRKNQSKNVYSTNASNYVEWILMLVENGMKNTREKLIRGEIITEKEF